MIVLLHYNLSSKVKEVSDSTQLLDVINNTFNLREGSYFLKKFDDGFQEYIDFDDLSLLDDRCKIKIISIPGSTSQSEDRDVLSENMSSVTTVTEDIDVEVILHLKSQWPQEVRLPFHEFSKPLLHSLENGKNLNWALSSELVAHLANYAYKFKCYPSKNERLQVCESLVNRYPYLRNDIGMGTGGWEIKLLNKLKKMRQNDTSLEVKLNREKRKCDTGVVPKRVKLNPKNGEVNWAPDHVEGETEFSQTLHKNIMKEEFKKSPSHQDRKKLRALMSLTYSFRRNAINNNVSISEIILEYPVLFQEDYQFEEFHRLTATDIKDFKEEVKENGSLLYQEFIRKKSDFLKAAREDVQSMFNYFILDSEDVGSSMNAKTALGLYVLPYLLKEPAEYFVEVVTGDKELHSVSPKIFSVGNIAASEFHIVAENHRLTKTNNFITAVGLLISFYYTLNIEYPKELSCTLRFLQIYFFKVNSETVPLKAKTLYKKIMSLKC